MDTNRQRRGDINEAFSFFVEAPEERASTLILRVWVEGGQLDGMRVRILTIGPHQAPPLAVSTVDDVLAAVQAWLDELLEPDG